MMSIEQIALWFPEEFRKKQYFRYIYREYFQYKILNYLANSPHNNRLTFIGGTCLRLLYGIDRFSEDLDFNIKNIDKQEFVDITDSVIRFLNASGYHVVAEDKSKDDSLNAYRRNLVFPGFLYHNKLSPFMEEKFLIKIEGQDQKKEYKSETSLFKGCSYVFRFNTPPISTLCAMKISALLNRQKGRDFYDVMFLLAKTEPDYSFFPESMGINNKSHLKTVLLTLCSKTNIKIKTRDFSHLLFHQEQGKKIMLFEDLVQQY